jgi:hypothetical protein
MLPPSLPPVLITGLGTPETKTKPASLENSQQAPHICLFLEWEDEEEEVYRDRGDTF